jgi:acetyl-CoA carboxylase biotin carboxyl carrier protein
MASHDIVSPLPGTFYRRPSPDADHFVEVGSAVHSATVIGLVEVMKQFTEIEAGVEGSIAEIFVEDGDAVDAGQVLMTVKGQTDESR